MRIQLLALVLLSGCYLVDPDADGKVGAADCNPNSAAPCSEVADTGDDIPPDTDEPCDLQAWFADADADGFGDPDAFLDACDQPAGYVADARDCDDADAAVALETTWYADADGDAYGDPAVASTDCHQPDGYVPDATDCDDGAANVHPNSGEWCNGVDDDCDGSTDENTSTAWYADADGDGFGNEEAVVDVICDGQSGGLVAPRDVTGEGAYDFDCDDADAGTFPLADEFCDGEDDDCDGATDEDEALDARTWYGDDDNDGYGNDADSLVACDAPAGYVPSDADCDDASASVYPGAAEACNDLDDDCDGSVPATETDDDLDGVAECEGDCDDASLDAYPGAEETCDGADNDCDGVTDESDSGDVAVWYHDYDADGYGDPGASWTSCEAPIGYVADGGDCDDADAAVNPDAVEMCNELDDDCDGEVDVAADDAGVWSVDRDGDGAGDDTYASWVASCDAPDGYVQDFTDCDDGDPSVGPDADEVYDDLVDNDCNGIIDDSGIACYVDADNDGFGAPTEAVYEPTGECDPGYVDHDSDCDDRNATTNPAEDDPYGDGVDSDCNGSAT